MIRSAFGRLREWASTRRRRVLLAGCAVAALWATVGCWQTVKPLPADLVFAGAPVLVAGSDLRFLVDLTFRDRDDRPVHEQEIFDRLFELVAGARRLLVLDLFLLNDHLGPDGACLRPLSSELTGALLEARRRAPDMPVVLLTDPINDLYGGDPSPQLAELRAAGVQVVATDLVRLRDSNPLYSAVWRLLFSWWGNSADGGWLPNPLDASGRAVGLRTYLRMANFKANHRKVVLADAGPRWHTLVTSANPHDASSAHSNVALEVASAGLARQVYAAEMEVLRLSGGTPPFAELPVLGGSDPGGDHRVAYLTESAVRDRVLELLGAAGSGDEVDLAMFYLSHRGVLEALVEAARRGAWVRLVLDPNRDAFGHAKSGIPNRQSAERLARDGGGGIAIRWYATHGEQFHTKMLAVRTEHSVDAVLGSTNFTRRNLDDYNLEASLWVHAPRGSDFDRELRLYVDRIWTNHDGAFTLPYAAFRDTSRLRRLAAWLQETTGLGTF
ncbi:MAG TPA: phospholipase D-like domain-containing protein [Candidatus Sulfomarinibacteraceae bacterium]|nr:phospholipase D-like domain-containing protein [Candidatus Sulfomarinibacteraceae bacterium]